MKKYFFIILFWVITANLFAQSMDSTALIDSNTTSDTIKFQSKLDTLLKDSFKINTESQERNYQEILNNLLKENKFINVSEKFVNQINNKRITGGKEYLFYMLCFLVLIFGFFKIFYTQYFNNIFRLFFNTSLRQNQLTDLLLQAKLPSLIFNLFFGVMAGIYVWLLLRNYLVIQNMNFRALSICVLIICIIYIVKFCVVKFLGWLTGMKQAADTYIFIVFLINKIIGVILIPLNIMIAFAWAQSLPIVIISSFFILGAFFILRFFRSYSLLQHQLEIKKIPFILYILAIEIIPLMIIYKWVTNEV